MCSTCTALLPTANTLAICVDCESTYPDSNLEPYPNSRWGPSPGYAPPWPPTSYMICHGVEAGAGIVDAGGREALEADRVAQEADQDNLSKLA